MSSGRTPITAEDERWMTRAVELAGRSVVEDRDDMRPPKVGVVIVGSDGQVLGESFRGEFMTPNGSPWHAEAGLLETRLKGVDLTGAVVYTTLEPCSRRGEGKTPCAERLVAAGVATVVIGIYDPNPNIYREGWKILHDGGVELRDFDERHRQVIREIDSDFHDQFEFSVGPERTGISFDYTLHNGVHKIYASGRDPLPFALTFSRASDTQIHVYGDNGDGVAYARYATRVDECDDPDALHYSRVQTIPLGGIAVLRYPSAYVFVTIDAIASTTHGSDRDAVRFSYTVRFNEAVGS